MFSLASVCMKHSPEAKTLLHIRKKLFIVWFYYDGRLENQNMVRKMTKYSQYHK